MRWFGLTSQALMGICGCVILLYAYRRLGKPPGADDKYDAAMSRQGSTYKVLGWCIVALAIIGLLFDLLAGP